MLLYPTSKKRVRVQIARTFTLLAGYPINCYKPSTILYLLQLLLKKVSEYDQEILQLQSADKPVAPRGRATLQSRDTRKTNKAKQPALSPSR